MLPVEVFVTRIKIVNWQKVVLDCLIDPFWRSWSIDLQRFKGQKYGIQKWTRFCHRNKEPVVLKGTNVLCYVPKKQKHYEW